MSWVSLVSGHVIVASCHYFTIRPKGEALGQLTKKGERRRGREEGRREEKTFIRIDKK